MSLVTTEYFTAVQRHLDEMGQTATLTADERDLIDDYETQQFGAEACAAHIAQERA